MNIKSENLFQFLAFHMIPHYPKPLITLAFVQARQYVIQFPWTRFEVRGILSSQ